MMRGFWPADQGFGRKAAPALAGFGEQPVGKRPNTFRETMRFARMRIGAAAIAGAAVLIAASLSFAQTTEPKAGDQRPAAENGKDAAKKVEDVYAEAERRLGGGPAANPECVWLGQRVVNLLVQDDLDTAFRHLDLYDRFGCPSGHIQTTFRCAVKKTIDAKAKDNMKTEIYRCWVNPDAEPTAAAAAAAPATQAQ
jgi:hypothetical protein